MDSFEQSTEQNTFEVVDLKPVKVPELAEQDFLISNNDYHGLRHEVFLGDLEYSIRIDHGHVVIEMAPLGIA